MNKLDAYVAAIELAIRAMDSAFVRSNAAENVRPLVALSARWVLDDTARAAAERAEMVRYDVTPDHWGARLALMSAFESLHGALRIVSSRSARDNPAAGAWREASARAAEAARLAACAERVLAGRSRD